MIGYGLQLPNFSLGVPDAELFEKVATLATAGEASGFESIWVMDHLYQLPALGGADQPMLEAYTLLGALAARTSRVRLGTLVTGVTYRNPALLAKIVTTLDVISSGRAILGIGAAWHDVEHEAFGFAFPPVKERMDRLEEALQICRGMFTDESTSIDGAHYVVNDVRNVPRPVQAGGPAIMVGGGGERRTLRLVAQYADMCNVSGDATTVRHKLDVLRGHCGDVGRDYDRITKTRLGTLVMTGSAAETEQTRAFLVDLGGEEFAAACTVGTDDEVVAQVGELLDAGIEYPIFNLPTADADGVRRAGELLGRIAG